MKLNRLDTHDRYLDFQKQWETISQGVLDCISHVPESIKFPYYIFAHPRTIDLDEQLFIVKNNFIPAGSKIPTTRLIYSPRVTKPKAQTNSYLFMSYGKHTDLIKTIWLLPDRTLWGAYDKGNMLGNEDVRTSIQNYLHSKVLLEREEPDGPTEQNIKDFRKIYGYEAQKKKIQKNEQKMIENLYDTRV